MIMRYLVDSQSRKVLDDALVTIPSALKYLKDPVRFNTWVDLLHRRVNELEWAIRSKWALNEFIKNATIAYANRQLDKAEMLHK